MTDVDRSTAELQRASSAVVIEHSSSMNVFVDSVSRFGIMYGARKLHWITPFHFSLCESSANSIIAHKIECTACV